MIKRGRKFSCKVYMGLNFKFKIHVFQIPGIKYLSLKDGECKSVSYTDEYGTKFIHKFVLEKMLGDYYLMKKVKPWKA